MPRFLCSHRAQKKRPLSGAASATIGGVMAQRKRQAVIRWDAWHQPRAHGWAWAPGRSRFACSVRSLTGLSRGVSVNWFGDLGSVVMMLTQGKNARASAAAFAGFAFLTVLACRAVRISARERPCMTRAALPGFKCRLLRLAFTAGRAEAHSASGRIGRELDHR